MPTPARSLHPPGLAFCLALTLVSGQGRAQDASALLASQRLTMQDMENAALRNTTLRTSTGPDTMAGGVQGNLFTGLQLGNDNRIDARQTGLGNVIQITQVGDMHSAVVVQSGSFNRAILRQGR